MAEATSGVCCWTPAGLVTERNDCAAIKAELELAILHLSGKPLTAAKRLLANVEKQLADLDEVLGALS